jgi:hypothetical protein
MRTLALVLTCAALALPGIARAYDHFDPGELVLRARQAIAEGDFPMACVLLARAGTLAPHDARVWLAWSDYEAAQNGVSPASPVNPQPAPTPVSVAPQPAVTIAPQPPAPWPAR